jgi:hypothetical protein
MIGIVILFEARNHHVLVPALKIVHKSYLGDGNLCSFAGSIHKNLKVY